MKEPLLALASDELRQLASALEAGRLAPPYSGVSLQRFVSRDVATDVAEALADLSQCGCSAPALARVVRMIATGLQERHPVEDVLQLVATGPDEAEGAPRPTSVVVSELFRQAESSVVVIGYAVYQGQTVFRDLADRMSEYPNIHVRMYLDIQRRDADTSAPEEIVRRFSDRFRTTQWPLDRRLPEVYYDPRSIAADRTRAASLHAKCIIVDNQRLFISSANFTEAAQLRNIEIGLLVHSSRLADRISAFFQHLVRAGKLQRAF